ncbi:hypothetical protein LWC05_09230, partial [Acetobacter sicerae]
KCFGKLISKTLYQVFISCIRGFINSKIDYDLFMRLSISENIKLMKDGLLPDYAAYISTQRSVFL